MTLGECKRKALELIFQYSVAGTEIPATYDNQADYINRIPDLVSAAQTEIAVTVKPIPALVDVSALQQETDIDFGDADVRKLPENLFRIMDGGLLRVLPDHTERTKNYRLIFGNRIVIFEKDISGLFLEFFRYPLPLAAGAADTAELENTADAQECVPYYVAAHLVLYDDPARYQALYAEYTRRLSELRAGKTFESGLISNAYG